MWKEICFCFFLGFRKYFYYAEKTRRTEQRCFQVKNKLIVNSFTPIYREKMLPLSPCLYGAFAVKYVSLDLCQVA